MQERDRRRGEKERETEKIKDSRKFSVATVLLPIIYNFNKKM